MEKKSLIFDVTLIAKQACLYLKKEEKQELSVQLEDMIKHFSVLDEYADFLKQADPLRFSHLKKTLREGDNPSDRSADVASLMNSDKVNSEKLFVVPSAF